MKRIISLSVAFVAVLLARPVQAGPLDVSASITAQPDGPDFDYTIKLMNSSSSTDSIQTFWYAWLPTPADFLPTSPISVTAPMNWSFLVTHFPNSDTNGFAIQYTTTSAPLAPGSSLDFEFKSADTPAQLAGDSPFYPGTPVGTSFVYQGLPFQGDALQFTVQSVPEPGSLTLAMIASIGGLGAWHLRRIRVARRVAA